MHSSISITAWWQPNPSTISCVLFERCPPPSPTPRQTYVYHQLHGDGACDWSTAELPSDSRTTNQGHFTAAEEGKQFLFISNNISELYRIRLYFEGGDKVNMLIHIYPPKPMRKTKVTICSHQADNPLCVAWCLIWWFASLEKNMVIHDTECPSWHKPNLISNSISKLYRIRLYFDILQNFLWAESLLHRHFSEIVNRTNLPVCLCETLGIVKVNMLTHTYPHLSLRKMKVAFCNHQVVGPLLCVTWSHYGFGTLEPQPVVSRHSFLIVRLSAGSVSAKSQTQTPLWVACKINNTLTFVMKHHWNNITAKFTMDHLINISDKQGSSCNDSVL